MNRKMLAAAALLMFVGAGCDHKAEPTAPLHPKQSTPAQSELTHGFTIDGACPVPAAGFDEGPAGPIPLKVGLTLAAVWRANADDYDHECLSQVTSIDAKSIRVSYSCPYGPNHKAFQHAARICKADLQESQLLHTQYGAVESIVGVTRFSLSQKSFKELKSHGSTPHRYLQIDSYRKVQFDDAGDLKLTGTNAHHESAPDTQSKFEVLVNGRSTSLPVVHAEGEIGEPGKRVHVKADVLDDFNFPLLLSYEHVESHFKHSLVKIDFPGELEQQLETEKHADIYGVYFDFGSDVMRPESDLVLQEVAEVMKKHPDWKLQVDGHTDNVGGGGAANLDLSRRRAAVVRVALMQRFAISADRLATGGFGAGRPKKTNDTIEGRALNRRVELRRF